MRINATRQYESLLALHLGGLYIGHMTMTQQDLEDWLRRMGKMRGKDRLSEREAAELLGWNRESLRPRLTGKRPVPTYIELACKMLEIMERAKQP